MGSYNSLFESIDSKVFANSINKASNKQLKFLLDQLTEYFVMPIDDEDDSSPFWINEESKETLKNITSELNQSEELFGNNKKRLVNQIISVLNNLSNL